MKPASASVAAATPLYRPSLGAAAAEEAEEEEAEDDEAPAPDEPWDEEKRRGGATDRWKSPLVGAEDGAEWRVDRKELPNVTPPFDECEATCRKPRSICWQGHDSESATRRQTQEERIQLIGCGLVSRTRSNFNAHNGAS